MKLAQELSDLVTYVQSVPFHGFSIARKQGNRGSYYHVEPLSLL